MIKHNNNKPYSQLTQEEKVKAAEQLRTFLLEERLTANEDRVLAKTQSNQISWMRRKLEKFPAVILTKRIVALDRLWVLEIGERFFISIVGDSHNDDLLSLLQAATGTKPRPGTCRNPAWKKPKKAQENAL
jgi:hypothetical protein